MTHDPVEHPKHYNSHPSGVECIAVVEHMNFNRGNAIKYLWRAGEKGDELEDLKKAAWYAQREVERVERERGSEAPAATAATAPPKFKHGQLVRRIGVGEATPFMIFGFSPQVFDISGDLRAMEPRWLYVGEDRDGVRRKAWEHDLELAA